MKQFLDNKNRIGALMTIVALAVGSVSIVGIGSTHVAMASQIGKLCVFFACGNATINGGTTSSGGGGGGQPTPTTGTLIVTKVINDPTEICNFPDFHPPECFPQNYTIKVTDDNPSPASFKGSGPPGTTVTLGPGKYTVSETLPTPGSEIGVDISFSGDCKQDSLGSSSASGNINAGETQKCTITNKLF